MKITGIMGGALGTNCWLLTDEKSGRTAVIDPGFASDRMFEITKTLGPDDKILLTHGHFDHITAAGALRQMTGAKIYITEQDAPFLSSPDLNLSGMMGAPLSPFSADVLLRDGDEISLGELSIRVMLTPGHTAGSCCYIVGNAIFSGDTLFCGSVGRTDFPTGSGAAILASVKKLAAMDGDFQIFPGHGETTTLEAERKGNPYLAMKDGLYDFDD